MRSGPPNDMSIRDTSAQDRSVAKPSGARRLRTRLLVICAGAAMMFLSAWLLAGWSIGGRSIDASRLRIAEVTRGDLVRDLRADGRVIAANSPTLYAIAGGTVTLKVVAGDEVKEGQTLAEMDSPELRSRLAQEQSTMASFNAEASRAELNARITSSLAVRSIDQAEIDRIAALRDLERNQRAFNGGAVAQLDVARAEDQLKKAELALAHASREHDLQGQGAALDLSNKRLLADRQRTVVTEIQRQVDALTLRAPFDGQVGQVFVAQRANVGANAPVLGVVDLSRLEVEIRVAESFARDLAISMPAQLASGSGQPFPGEVSAVSPEVVNGEVVTRLRFTDKQPTGLRQNQRLSARITLDTRKDVLQVERGPFVDQSDGRFAYVVEGSSAVRRPIRAGVSSLGAVEILEGLQAGDRVVVSGADQFGDAERIRISGEL